MRRRAGAHASQRAGHLNENGIGNENGTIAHDLTTTAPQRATCSYPYPYPYHAPPGTALARPDPACASASAPAPTPAPAPDHACPTRAPAPAPAPTPASGRPDPAATHNPATAPAMPLPLPLLPAPACLLPAPAPTTPPSAGARGKHIAPPTEHSLRARVRAGSLNFCFPARGRRLCGDSHPSPLLSQQPFRLRRRPTTAHCGLWEQWGDRGCDAHHGGVT